AVEALGLLHVTHRDVDVGDVAVGHAASSHRCGRRSATVTRVWHWGPTGAAQFPCYPATQRPGQVAGGRPTTIPSRSAGSNPSAVSRSSCAPRPSRTVVKNERAATAKTTSTISALL